MTQPSPTEEDCIGDVYCKKCNGYVPLYTIKSKEQLNQRLCLDCFKMTQPLPQTMTGDYQKNAEPELTGKWTKKGVDALIDIFAENPEELAKRFSEQHNKVVAKLEASLKTRHNEITRVRNQLKRLEAEKKELHRMWNKSAELQKEAWEKEVKKLKQELAKLKVEKDNWQHSASVKELNEKLQYAKVARLKQELAKEKHNTKIGDLAIHDGIKANVDRTRDFIRMRAGLQEAYDVFYWIQTNPDDMDKILSKVICAIKGIDKLLGSGKEVKCKHSLKEIEAIGEGYIYYKCEKCGAILVNQLFGNEGKEQGKT